MSTSAAAGSDRYVRVCPVHKVELRAEGELYRCPRGREYPLKYAVVDRRTHRVIQHGEQETEVSRRDRRRARWADPEVRARMSAARKKALADPEVRARMSAASKKAWADLKRLAALGRALEEA